MIRQLPIYLAASALLGSPLLAQDAPRPQPTPEAPRPEPRKDDARRDGGPGGPRPERPVPPPPRADGERPLPPPDGDGPDPFGPPPGGPRGGGPRDGGPRDGGPRDGQRRPPGDRRGDGPESERPPGFVERSPEGFGRPPGFGGNRFGQVERASKPTPYIGVVTSPVPPVLAAQLGLNEGFGLVVEDVLPDSPAKAAGLQKYDVLKLVNDQQLVDPGHLSGLLRGFGKDTEVAVTFFRKGQEQKATVKIGEKLMPERQPGFDLQRNFLNYGLPFSPREQGDDPRGRGQQGPPPEQMRRLQERMEHFQEDMHRYQERLQEWQKDRSAPLPEPPTAPEFNPRRGDGPSGPADLLREARPGGAGQLRLPQTDGVSTFRTNRARIAMKDNDGEIEVAMHDGQRTLTAKGADGGVVFTGPVDTPEQRAAMPAPLRAKLEALEAQQRSIAEERAPRPRGGRDEAPFPPPPPPVPSEPEVQ